jgi:DNA-binding GntR family transcriptional regulator/dihydrofolate reductase
MSAPRTDLPELAAGQARVGGRLGTRALYEQVAEQLRTRILAHTLAPGSWIDEQALAAEYGISRTPLREALKVLAAEGLVTMKLRRGAYVTEVFHLLALLESDAARIAAQKATPTEISELLAIHDELESAIDDRDRFFAANERFHMRLLEIADNRWRVQMVADLRKVMKLNRRQSLFKQGRLEASLKEHRQIMAALKSRNAERVRVLMQSHLEAGREAAALAVPRNRAIGRGGELIFHESEDQKHFRRVTLGCPVIMGRKTWDSLPPRFQPLPGRRNIVVTRNALWSAEGAVRAGSLDEALKLAAGAAKVFVIGGADLYALALPRADELELTEIDAEFDGDVFFPDWPRHAFRQASSEPHVTAGGIGYSFNHYIRQEAN